MTDTNEEFERVANLPASWQITARRFVCAANALYERYEDIVFDERGHMKTRNDNDFFLSLTPTLLLYAYAIENLLKALLIVKGMPAVKNNKLNPALAKHSLSTYCDRVGISTSTEEKSLLMLLEKVMTSGKYPVAKEPRSRSIGNKLPRDILMIGGLLSRLEDALRTHQVSALPAADLLTLCRQRKEFRP